LRINFIKNDKNYGIQFSLSKLVSLAEKNHSIGIFLGQDDMLSRNYVKEMIKIFQDPKLVFAYSVLKSFNSTNFDKPKFIVPINLNILGKFKTALLLHGNYITSPGVTFRLRNFPGKLIEGTPNLLHDWAQFLWMHLDGTFKISYKTNVHYRIHSNQTTKIEKIGLKEIEEMRYKFVTSKKFQSWFSKLNSPSRIVFYVILKVLDVNKTTSLIVVKNLAR